MKAHVSQPTPVETDVGALGRASGEIAAMASRLRPDEGNRSVIGHALSAAIRMTEKGLIEAEWREPTQVGRPARHAYRLTADGIVLAQATANPSTAIPSLWPY